MRVNWATDLEIMTLQNADIFDNFKQNQRKKHAKVAKHKHTCEIRENLEETEQS